MHDELPNDRLHEDNNNDHVDIIAEDNFPNLTGALRGRQERDRLIKDHFANLE